jgi:hypothetical protein
MKLAYKVLIQLAREKTLSALMGEEDAQQA